MKKLFFTVLFHLLVVFVTKGQISIITTNATDCTKQDGKAIITVNGAAEGFTFEYAVDGTFTDSNTFNNLTAGNHVATVRDKTTKCEFSKNFMIESQTQFTWYRDVDGDGYGRTWPTKLSCKKPNGYVDNALDCKDGNPNIHPGATEICDGRDNNCNGEVDEGFTLTTWYWDGDRDGYGHPGLIRVSCFQPLGYVDSAGDCKDGDVTINPGAEEICDGKDNDCDGLVDEGLPLLTWYRDVDGDGYGRSWNTKLSCKKPKGYVDNALDCKDGNPNIHPNATELCDGRDNNCNSVVDEGCFTTEITDVYKPVYPAKTSAKADEPKLQIKLWPNPVRDVLMVSLDEFEAGRKLEMVLIQVDGKPIASQSLIPTVKGQQVKFDLRRMAAGYFLLQVRQGNLAETKRFMIIR